MERMLSGFFSMWRSASSSSRDVVTCMAAPSEVSIRTFTFSWPYARPSRIMGTCAHRHSVTTRPPDLQMITSLAAMSAAMSST